MAWSYSASHPDLPGEGITPKTGPDSARPAFTGSSSPSPSPSETAASERAGDSQAQRPPIFTDRALGNSKPRDPAPRLEPHPNVVRVVHTAVANGARVRKFAPTQRQTGPARPAASMAAATRPQGVTIGPKSEQERDLSAAMAAYQRMEGMQDRGIRQEFGKHRGRGV